MKTIFGETLKINSENQHRKPTLKINTKINIKKIEKVEKTSIFSTWPVVIIDQDALHACIQHITRIHSFRVVLLVPNIFSM